MPAKTGPKRLRNRAIGWEAERGVFEGFDHLARAKPWEFAPLARRTFVVAVLHGHFLPWGASLEFAVNGANPPFSFGDLEGVLRVSRPHHDVGDLDFPAGLATAGHFEEVVPEARADNRADAAHLGAVRRHLEGVDHRKCSEPTEISTVVPDGGVVGTVFGLSDGLKILTGQHTIPQLLRPAPRDQRVFRRRSRAAIHENVTRPHLLLLAVVGLPHERLQEFAVRQIRPGELGPVALQLPLERLRGVHAQRLGFRHLQAEIHEEFEVLIEGFPRDDTVAVVLHENRLEITEGH